MNPGNRLAAAKSVLLLGVIFLMVVPSTPPPLGPGLHESWALALNLAHHAGMQFGRDIIFTYGPLGYLAFPSFPEAEPWAVLAFWWFIALVTTYALWNLCKLNHDWRISCLYLVVYWVACAFLFHSSYDPVIERVLVAGIALATLIAARLDTGSWLDLGLLSFLAALVLLIKFNTGVIASLVAFYFTGYLVWRSRYAKPAGVALRAVVMVTIWLSTLVGLYWMLDGTPTGLFAFLGNSIEVARGYSDAMAMPGPAWGVAAAVLSCFVLLVGMPLIAGDVRSASRIITPLAVISFLCFKSAMVRQDVHPLPFPFQLAIASLMFVAGAKTLRRQLAVGSFAVAFVALGAVTAAVMWPKTLPGTLDRLVALSSVRDLRGFLHWGGTVRGAEASTEQALTRDQLPSSAVSYLVGRRVGVYPSEIAMLPANHLRWQPLPVIQSYSAYTPSLDALNSQVLEDSSGPEKVLLSWCSIDNHHPFYETPQSWRALLDWYDLQLSSPTLDVLQRRATRRFSGPVQISSMVARWRQGIQLPPVADDEALLMQADIGESWKGVLTRLLFRSPLVRVRATLRSGLKLSARVVRINLEDGVIVSDFPQTLSDLAPMLTGGGGFLPDRVVSISLRTTSLQDFSQQIRIRFWRLKLRAAGSPAASAVESLGGAGGNSREYSCGIEMPPAS